MRGARQIGMAMLQPALPQILTEAHPCLLEQLLYIAGGHALLIGDLMQGKVAIAELEFDRLGDAMEIAGPGDIETAHRRAFREAGDDELGKRDLDRSDMFVRQLLEIVDDGMQQTGEDAVDGGPDKVGGYDTPQAVSSP